MTNEPKRKPIRRSINVLDLGGEHDRARADAQRERDRQYDQLAAEHDARSRGIPLNQPKDPFI